MKSVLFYLKLLKKKTMIKYMYFVHSKWFCIYITSYIWTPGFAVIVFKSPYGWLFKSIIDLLMNTRIKLID